MDVIRNKAIAGSLKKMAESESNKRTKNRMLTKLSTINEEIERPREDYEACVKVVAANIPLV